MRAIFISYRRDDTEGEAGRLFGDLATRFGQRNVFMDVAGLEAGRDFRKELDKTVEGCGVLLSLVGRSWLTVADEQGNRRLDDPDDFVRLETASALRRDIPVIPVLVHGARMPRSEQLPDDLKEFAYRNAVELTHARWSSDIKLLEDALAKVLDREKSMRTGAQRPWWRNPLLAGALVLVIVGAAAMTLFLHRGKTAPPPEAQSAANQAAALISPTAQPIVTPQNTTGQNQSSADGASSSQTTAASSSKPVEYSVRLLIMQEYLLQAGGKNPLTLKLYISDGDGLFATDADGIRVYYTAGTAAHFVQGEIGKKWIEAGDVKSPLGYPTTDEASDGNGGIIQKFANGSITWTQQGGAVIQQTP